MIAGTSEVSEIAGANQSEFVIPADVEPTRMSLYRSHPCEKKAAKIRNNALAEMRKGAVGNVAYFILKCKRGMYYPLLEVFAGLYGLLSLISTALYKAMFTNEELIPEEASQSNWYILLNTVQFLVIYQFISASFANCVRYLKTIWDCEKFLDAKLAPEALRQIKRLNSGDHQELHDILSNNNLEAPLLYTDPHKPITRPIIISREQGTPRVEAQLCFESESEDTRLQLSM